MSAYVLVVDDNVEFARRAADLITSRTGLESVFASSLAAAVAATEHNAVAVAVIDQRMPEIEGTELFLRLRRLCPGLNAIMLTGEANANEVGRAMEVGFSEYLHKTRISELPDRVVGQYLGHLIANSDGSHLANAQVVWPTRRWERLLRRREVRLVSFAVLEAENIDEANWRTVLQLSAGEQRRIVNEHTVTYSLSVENESQQALKTALKFGRRAAKSAAESVVEASRTLLQRHAISASHTRVRTNEQTYSLPLHEGAADDVYVRSRNFQQTKVRARVLATYQVRCKCCDLNTLVPLVLLQDTGTIATRHHDFLSDGTSRIINTGYISAHGEVAGA